MMILVSFYIKPGSHEEGAFSIGTMKYKRCGLSGDMMGIFNQAS